MRRSIYRVSNQRIVFFIVVCVFYNGFLCGIILINVVLKLMRVGVISNGAYTLETSSQHERQGVYKVDEQS